MCRWAVRWRNTPGPKTGRRWRRFFRPSNARPNRANWRANCWIPGPIFHPQEPLYISVTSAIKQDQALYEFLALVNTLRIGRARERKLAEEELKDRLSHAHAA